jgi:2-keto-4-pentenoate hydratase/2-oxohepta-3-ene-1,7-dioic acid hydratase in catechol pathway
MRLVCFHAAQADRYGILREGKLHEIASNPRDPAAIGGLLANPAAAPTTGAIFDLDKVDWLPPVVAPGKIFCVATNFREPANIDKPLPDYPLLFTRFSDSLVGHGKPLQKPAVSAQYDFEGELALIIGRPGFRIPQAEAARHVAGYSCFNDGSLRDWQKHSSQFTPGKNFFSSGSFGPALVTTDEIADFAGLRLETRVNGKVMQSIGMGTMIFSPAWLIAYVSTFTPLAAGDVIVTGTPSGFGSSRTPQRFLSPGDEVEVEITGIGLLRNRVEAEHIS